MKSLCDTKRLTDSARAILDRCTETADLTSVPLELLLKNTNALALVALRRLDAQHAQDLMRAAVIAGARAPGASADESLRLTLDSRLNMLRMRATRPGKAPTVLECLQAGSTGNLGRLLEETNPADQPPQQAPMNTESAQLTCFFAMTEIGYRYHTTHPSNEAKDWALGVLRTHPQLVWSGAFQPLELLSTRGYAVRLPQRLSAQTGIKWKFIDWSHSRTDAHMRPEPATRADHNEAERWWMTLHGGDLTFISAATKVDWLQRTYELSPRQEWARSILRSAIDIDYEQGVHALLSSVTTRTRAQYGDASEYLTRRRTTESEVRDCSLMHLAELKRRAKGTR